MKRRRAKRDTQRVDLRRDVRGAPRAPRLLQEGPELVRFSFVFKNRHAIPFGFGTEPDMVACRQAVGLESRVHGLMFRCDAVTGHRAGMECLARCANGVVSPSPGGGFAPGAVCVMSSMSGPVQCRQHCTAAGRRSGAPGAPSLRCAGRTQAMRNTAAVSRSRWACSSSAAAASSTSDAFCSVARSSCALPWVPMMGTATHSEKPVYCDARHPSQR
jgi:hypothetical protein